MFEDGYIPDEEDFFCGECSQVTTHDHNCGVEFEGICDWCGAELD